MPRLLLLVIIARLALGFASAADSSIAGAIDTEKSVITVRVFKAGFFSAFAHDHEISAPIEQGGFNEGNTSVEVKVDARKLRVVDKEISERDRAEIQQTMLGPKVLDSEKFPEICFRASGGADRPRLGRLTIEGELTLHGQTHPVRVEVIGMNGHYHGTAQLKQKDFGITPISLGGGTVKVKNELRVEFDVVGR